MEADARAQVWDASRPWRVRTHVVWERDALCLDLHDLKARNAKKALSAMLEVIGSLECSEILVVTGRGTHSLGPPVLRRLAGERLAMAASETDGWSLHPRGSGAWLLSTDPARAADRGPAGFLLLFFLLLGLALLWLLSRAALS